MRGNRHAPKTLADSGRPLNLTTRVSAEPGHGRFTVTVQDLDGEASTVAIRAPSQQAASRYLHNAMRFHRPLETLNGETHTPE